MIDLNKCEGWQKRDTDGIVMPWYTHSALDEICTWELKDKLVFEYGGGQSTLWWVNKCYRVFSVDSSSEWVIAVKNRLSKDMRQAWIKYVDEKEIYVNVIGLLGLKFDIIIVDGSPEGWRDDCIKVALEYLKPEGALIVDNWMQPSVWTATEETQKLLSKYKSKIFRQDGHPDWSTAIFYKP